MIRLILASITLAFVACAREGAADNAAQGLADGATRTSVEEAPAPPGETLPAQSFDPAAQESKSVVSTAAAPLPAPVQAASAPEWALDKAKSRLSFASSQSGASFDGEFKTFEAKIQFDPEHLEGSSIGVTVDMASATTGDKQRDTALPDSDWFAVKQFPTARFQSKKIVAKSADAYEAEGTLTIRGVAKPLTLPFRLSIEGSSARATAAASIVRTEFGVGQGDFSTDEWVDINVVVKIDIIATKQ
jgi:polyisoprenoid-binding protein YceI